MRLAAGPVVRAELAAVRVVEIIESSNSGELLISSFVRFTKIFSSDSSIDFTTPAGSMTFLPKIHGPVSMTR